MDNALTLFRDGSVSITDTIKRVSLPTFAKRPRHKSKDKKVSSLKRDAHLVSHLFLSLQSCPDFDLDDFFKFENQKEPPSLSESDQGMLRHGKKSDILQCMQIPKLSRTNDQTMKILDGAAIVIWCDQQRLGTSKSTQHDISCPKSRVQWLAHQLPG